MSELVRVDGLTVDFWTGEGWANVVNGVSFSMRPGEAFGLVGESGCGKTTTALTLLGFRRPGSRIRAGEVRLDGRNLLALGERELQRLRGARVALVPQNPTTALTPGMRIATQLEEAMRTHGVGASRDERRARAETRRPSSTRSGNHPLPALRARP